MQSGTYKSKLCKKFTSFDELKVQQHEPQFFWFFCVPISFHLCCILLLSSVPPISRDALIHHLAIPKMYLLQRGMYEIPSMHFSYFPMNLDLLYLLPLHFNFDIGAKYIHFLFALFTAALIYRYLTEKLNRIYGLIGALLFLTTPIIVKLSVTAYVDLGLIFFSWACLYFVINWYDTHFKLRYLVFAGIACGLALGTKYNGLILLFIMAAMIPLVYSRKMNQPLAQNAARQRNVNSLKGLQWGAVFVLVALILFSPWMARNTIWKHNPVYPLYNSFFNPPQEAVQPAAPQEEREPQNAFWMRRHVYNESFVQTVFIPVRAFFQGQDDNPKYFDGKLNPGLLLLPLLAFIWVREKRLMALRTHRNIFAVFAIIFTLFVLFQADFRIRYMAPALPPLVVLSVFGVKNLVEHLSQRKTGFARLLGQGAVVLFVSFVFLYNANYIRQQFDYIRPFDYLTKKVDRDTYVARYRFEQPVIVQANNILPKDARVLCLSIGDRTYYVERSVHLAEDFYNRKDGVFTESDLLQKLSRYDTTHIIFHRDGYLDWVRTLPVTEMNTFENVFRNYTKVLYEENGVQLLELRHEG